MSPSWFISLLFSTFLAFAVVTASSFEAQELNVPDYPLGSTYLAVREALRRGELQKRGELQVNKTFSRSWDDAVILKISASQDGSYENQELKAKETIEITCKTCYVQGGIKAQLQYPDKYDYNNTLVKVIDDFEGQIKNYTETVVDDVETFFYDQFDNKSLWQDLGIVVNDIETIDDLPIALPPIDQSFHLNLSAVPQIDLSFEFDDLEVYMDLETSLAAEVTYDINLWSSDKEEEDPFAPYISWDLGTVGRMGIFVTLDLIFSADGEVNVSSGFHLKFDRLGFNIGLFNTTIDELIHNGGIFEMLPVTVESAGVVLGAALRLGIKAGVDANLPGLGFHIAGWNLTPKTGGGIEAGVYANIVDLTSNITDAAKENGCEIQAVQSFQFGVGAAAGATAYVGDHTWGPAVSTTTPVFTTTLGTDCILRASSERTSSAAKAMVTSSQPTSLSMTRKETTVTYSGVQCKSTIAGGCPASLQVTIRNTSVTVVSMATTPGVSLTWPSTPGVINAVPTTKPFNDALSISATSGAPTAYTAPPSIEGAVSALEGDVDHVSKKLIFGLAIGLGGAILIAGIVVAILLVRRKRYVVVANPQFKGTMPMNAPDMQKLEPYRPMDKIKQSVVEVREI